MEEKLVLCVSEFPELFDTSLRLYRDIGRKAVAWKHISNQVGVSEDECKRRWKNLRDRYIKERKTMREKKSGAGAEHKTTWKYFSIMSFLEPHVRERATSSNLSPSLEERSSAPDVTSALLAAQSPPPETFTLYLTEVSPSSPSTPASLATDESSETLPDPVAIDVSQEHPSTSASYAPAASAVVYRAPATSAASHAPAASYIQRAPLAPQASSKTKKRQQQKDEFESQVMNVLNQSADEEELFLLSLAPRLRNLSPEKRSEIKIEILTAFHRAEFS